MSVSTITALIAFAILISIVASLAIPTIRFFIADQYWRARRGIAPAEARDMREPLSDLDRDVRG